MHRRSTLHDTANVPRLSLLLSYSSALFSANGAPQLFSYQSFPHSFPFKGGGGLPPLFSACCFSHFCCKCSPFAFNNFHDAPPATLFFSSFCIVTGSGYG